MGHTAVDREQQRLHGVSFVVSTALDAGAGVLLDALAVRVDRGAEGVRVKWGTIDQDFASNVLRIRSELWAGVSVLRPGGVVSVELAKAAGV
ncbi:hypothetical protein C5O27_06720 [Gordonia alkanivorans]|uniref:hypothetical protein n=1 Tax=Gordonia alkanivorans TaxID=84096 RepID=UPI000FDE9D09|nr:hypothetical protein [Gordonia alkanivorans]AZZ80797.1 hypothetical protein C5O27_06720 [Gordonia alkanivorans]